MFNSFGTQKVFIIIPNPFGVRSAERQRARGLGELRALSSPAEGFDAPEHYVMSQASEHDSQEQL